MIALGVIAAVWLFGRRLEQKSLGTRDDAASIALWAVPAGVIGARLYHVITDWQLFRDDPVRVFDIWEGGLGIWGGIALGVAVGLWRGREARASRCSRRPTARRRRWPWPRPSDAWATGGTRSCSAGRRTCRGGWRSRSRTGPEGYDASSPRSTPRSSTKRCGTWACAWRCVAIDRRFRLRPGRLFVMYVAGYTFARFWIEGLRIDSANEFAGLRVNEWVSAIVFLLAAGFLVVDWLRHRHDPVEEVVDADEPGPAEGAPRMGRRV